MPTLDSYWAAVPSDQIGEHLYAKVERSGTASLTSTLNGQYQRSYQYYFGQDPSGIHATSQVLRGGEAGELAEIRVNHSRPLVNTLLNLIVAPKIVWTPKAVNIDYDSIRECELARAVLEYYWLERDVSRLAVGALEQALVFTEGFAILSWDENAGDDVVPDGEQIVKSGDIVIRNVSAWDVIRDSNKTSYDRLDWVIVRERVNKYDLMAKYPDISPETFMVEDDVVLDKRKGVSANDETDDISVYTFFHKRTGSMPKGRETVFLSNRAVVADGALSWDEIPLYRVSAGELTGTPYGYSAFLDILGIQELMDSLHTSVASNQTALATQCISMENGTDASPDDVAGGMKVFYYPSGGKPPEALQLLKTPPEVFNYIQSLKSNQELCFGLNSVVRGEPQSGDQSGSALAHLSSQALQQASTIQSNYLRFVSDIGNGVLACIRKRLSAEKKVGLVGKSSQFLVDDTSYSGKSFNRIKRVQVEIGNPLAQTTSGRDMIAKDYIQAGLVKSPEQLQMLHETGRLEPLTQSLSHELLLIRSENESLARGEDVPCLVLDDHKLHAREHRALLANPQARKNPDVVKAVLSHIDMHEQLYTTAPPLTLIMVGQEPPPMMPPGMGPPPPGMGPPTGPGGPSGPPMPPKGLGAPDMGGPGPDGKAPPEKPPGPLPGGARLPNLPKNPATGVPPTPAAGAASQSKPPVP